MRRTGISGGPSSGIRESRRRHAAHASPAKFQASIGAWRHRIARLSPKSGRSWRVYEHALVDFSAREKNGAIELVIELKNRDLGLHTYYAPLHPRDIDHSQFPWTLQRYLYDCLHDYVVEMFIRTPQSRNT